MLCKYLDPQKYKREVKFFFEAASSKKTLECLLCGSNELKTEYRRLNRDVVSCCRCHVAFVRPLPREHFLSQYYANTYAWNQMRIETLRSLAPDELLAVADRTRELNILRRYLTKGRVLELGASCGFFLELARRSGFEVEGVELGGHFAQIAWEKFQLRIHNADFLAIDFESESIDAIMAIHVLEHIVKPLHTLRKCIRVLKDDGLMFIFTPNWNSYLRKNLGFRWEWLNLNDHYFYFSKAVFDYLQAEVGFKIVEVKTSDGHWAFPHHNYPPAGSSLELLYERMEGNELMVIIQKASRDPAEKS